ncbi:MAG: glycosyl transferase family 1 [Herbaspirillum sp.]|nr:glycosyl transferase family 1 [Herbaspirillum sp.]
MRIVIDLQGAQTESRYRGIGRYSMAITLALAKASRKHDIRLVLNGQFPQSALTIRQTFAGILPADHIHVFDVPAPTLGQEAANALRAEAAEKLREHFIAQLRPDVVLITSLFEGFVNDAVTSVGRFDVNANTAVILYDLIPLHDPERYLKTPTQKIDYARKIESLKRAGMLLAISDYSRQEGIESLGLPAERVVSISAAADEHFRPETPSAEWVVQLRQRYGVTRKIILSVPGGFDPRKNIDGLINAFAQLPPSLRAEYQLVIISRSDEVENNYIHHHFKQAGLKKDELILTGYVDDTELRALYREATLCVFCSKHEGFGLPVLEAMACGAAVIGSCNTSIPEVIGCEDALFDPFSLQSITDKMTQVLSDPDWLQKMREKGPGQAAKFSWEVSARKLLAAVENRFGEHPARDTIAPLRPRLAFVSPLPPQQTGIADYCAQLLPELSRHFDIELIVEQPELTLAPELDVLPRRSAQWFVENGASFDRVLYQVGNSPFHTYMFDLIALHPGVVVLHDFFLSAVLAYEEERGLMPGRWQQALYRSHGYMALRMRAGTNDVDGADLAKHIYPSNLEVLQKAKSIIVHSDYSQQLARHWYGATATENWTTIPLLRITARDIDCRGAREQLRLDPDAFVVCSFGFIDPTKQSLRLVDAWLASRLAANPRCHLILVGQNHGGDYGVQLLERIRNSGVAARIRITGWTESDDYRRYLEASDVGVQLRSASRGETSAAVLDCMNYGLPTIVNACGSSADIPDRAAYKLADAFTDTELIVALESLWNDDNARHALGSAAAALIADQHSPVSCAQQYATAINRAYAHATTDFPALLQALAESSALIACESDTLAVAQAVANSTFEKPALRQLLVDVTSIARTDLKTGIERVVRAQLLKLMETPPAGFRVEPVRLSDEGIHCHYRYARSFTCAMLGIPVGGLIDQPVDIAPGDIFYGLDFAPSDVVRASFAGVFSRWRAFGIVVSFVVYDLLPILKPHCFPEGASDTHSRWLAAIASSADRLIGISAAVIDELTHWLDAQDLAIAQPLRLSSVLLGADFEAPGPNHGLPKKTAEIARRIKKSSNFLMVGTIEPRKGYLQALQTFEQLWREGHQVCLTIVGAEGWMSLPTEMRRTIPEIVKRISNHPELGKRLFWLKAISDEHLQNLYGSSTCLLAASEGEGFGLPLIEAARAGLPVIARDLPVFREVMELHAFYFTGMDKDDLATAIRSWLQLHAAGKAPSSTGLQWLSWKQHVEMISAVLLSQGRERIWASQRLKHKALEQHLDLIHGARVAMVRSLVPAGRQILDLGGANCPLYKMDYPYAFEKLTLIDLPPDQRHSYYKDIVVDSDCPLGPIVLRYTDMTTLDGIADESVDLVWSGESIEHVPQEAGERMCREAFRVLKKGGAFCLDTPNRRVTEIHVRTVDSEFIHPEHFIEYSTELLMAVLTKAGFVIKHSYGICEMPETVRTGEFHYEDFLFGKQITDRVADSYIQFHHCIKP